MLLGLKAKGGLVAPKDGKDAFVDLEVDASHYCGHRYYVRWSIEEL